MFSSADETFTGKNNTLDTLDENVGKFESLDFETVGVLETKYGLILWIFS